MVEIIPFRGIRYNSEKVELSKVVAPPYDVIPEKEREKYARYENNIVHIILPEDNENNRYTNAARKLKSWIEEGILQQDEKPSIYVYEQEYTCRGRRKVMRGFIALAKLESYESGKILPHEDTLPGAIKDRLELLRACRANLSPIFTFYSDPNREIDLLLERRKENTADIELGDIRHRFWKLSSSDEVSRIIQLMADKTVFIADGHHRYETSLAFSREKKYRYTMMYFTNMDAGGLTILPAHRLINGIKGFSARNFLNHLVRYFSVERIGVRELSSEMEARGAHVFGIYLGRSLLYLITLADEAAVDKFTNPEKSKAWRRLDVTIVHSLIINHILDLQKDNIVYVTEEGEAMRSVDNGKYQLAILMNPTKLDEVVKIALAGERMHGKATYFYPKLLTGLVINKVD
ncbi:MAG: DUF1015 domain-containing protein [Candidatus Hydrothermarchaeaceae archaeon]